LHQSQHAYDKRVARGVISGGGDYKPSIVLDKQQSQTAESRLLFWVRPSAK
jgi:hypothetical protein